MYQKQYFKVGEDTSKKRIMCKEISGDFLTPQTNRKQYTSQINKIIF